MSENGEPVGREGRTKLLAGRISCAVGMIFAVVGVVDAIAGGGASISAGALGAALGILGYFLDANRLGTATVVLSIAALFFSLAASQGYIPGIEASDRGLPAVEPSSGD
ncbi:MAG: hypothetical protein LC781_22710 [Actinobacteria bacterium]|nr:hypothetical protein [Actinomycetota bacterium]